MDRSDEAKDVRSDESAVVRDAETPAPVDIARDTPKRAGDILGLGGSVVPKAADDPTTEYDEESVARRRARSNEVETVPGGSDRTDGKGATGIDMGSGGTGTDINRT